MPLLEVRNQYKPFEYPWAFEFWKRQQQLHWLPEEVPLGEDCRDWAQKLSDHERNLLTQIFRFFTQADVEAIAEVALGRGSEFGIDWAASSRAATGGVANSAVQQGSRVADTLPVSNPGLLVRRLLGHLLQVHWC